VNQRSVSASSRFLRIAKEAPPDTEEGLAALRLAGEFLCRVVVEETPLLRHVDVVVSIPANPARYGQRMVSLPDELARALESHFALPFLFGALVSAAADNLELRGLNWHERHEAIRGSMCASDLGIGKDRCLLLVDDITTSGATLQEAARVLRNAGAGDVYAVTLSHTEG
jgi:predicted amidophosphoribosyltransferase